MKKGFTLVEVVLMIMIIGILAGIVWAALNPSEIFNLINTSRQDNNLKALDQAFEHYALDNKNQAPEILALSNNQPYLIVNGAGTYNSPMDCNQVVGDINTTTISSLIPGYLATVPVHDSVSDPGDEGSGYYVMRKGSEIRVGSCFGDYDFDNGLVALWHMDESSWGTVVDALGTNNLAATNSPVPTNTDPKIGDYSGDFNVSGDAYIYKNSPTGLPSGDVAKTIMAWAKASSACASTSCVIGGFGNIVNGQNFQMAFNSANFIVYGWGGGYDWGTGVATANYRENWHHFALTYSPPTTKFYIDGVMQASTNSYAWNTSPTYIVLGNEIDKNTRKFQGQIDEFSIWSRALSDAEIKAIYNLEL